MGASFLAQNAGKKSVTLNLKTAEGKDVLRRLVAQNTILFYSSTGERFHRTRLATAPALDPVAA